MAIVLGVTGLVVYRLFRSDLDNTIATALGSRSDEVAALVRRGDQRVRSSLRQVSGEEDDFAQVLSLGGTSLADTPQVRGRVMLQGALLRRAARGPLVADHPPIAELDGALRMRAVSVDTPRGREIVVVGTSLGERDGELHRLAALLAGGGGLALILASLAGYGVAAGALRPVEAMRRRAAAVSPAESGRRLPVPRSEDEIARLGSTLNEMLDRLEAGFARERAFAAEASHELRTPLGILKAELELALRRGRSAEELRAALESAAEETDRLVQLAEDLLVIARFDEGRLVPRRVEVNIADLLGAVAGRFGSLARDAGRSLKVAPGEPIRLAADRLHLEQALGNMVDNALRHGRGDVRLRAVTQNSAVELHVDDDGPGFDPAFVDHAFERFARADGARSVGGSGLGLSIVAAIAASHGGRARAANRPEGGADVCLELPRVSPA